MVVKMAGKKRGWYTSETTQRANTLEVIQRLGKLTAEPIEAAVTRAKCFATIQEAFEALFGVLRRSLPATQLEPLPIISALVLEGLRRWEKGRNR